MRSSRGDSRAGSLRDRRLSAAHDDPNLDALGAEDLLEPVLPIPGNPLAAAIEVERGQEKLRIRVTRQVRFAEQIQASYTCRVRKSMPLRFSDDLQFQVADELFAQPPH